MADHPLRRSPVEHLVMPGGSIPRFRSTNGLLQALSELIGADELWHRDGPSSSDSR